MYVWAALAALGLATACKREAIDLSLPDTAEVPMGMVCVQVETTDAPDILTKVDGNAAQSQNERKVNSMQVFVFKKNGNDTGANPLEADKYVSGASATTLNTLTGNNSIWAVVNAPRLYSIHTEKELMETISYLKENRADNLVMSGQSDAVVFQYNASENGNVGNVSQVNIDVTRLCARISLHTVAADFTGTSLEGASMTLVEAYLINVPASVGMDGTPLSASELNSGGAWYNFRKLGTSADELLLNDSLKLLKEDGLSIGINTADALVGTAVDKCFYVYPNVSVVKSDDESPSARMTRLVLHVYIGTAPGGRAAHDSYYSFNVPVFGSGKCIERNHIYDISRITITGDGSPIPPPFPDREYGKVNATITISEWGGTETITYEI